ncbi:MAG: TonB-dependent receptor [Bergeyella zoohelcum]|nr:TonB-dependent receptor [Bergeyella zoohelcum]
MNQMEWRKWIFSFGLRQEWFVDYNNYKLANEIKVKQNKFLKRAGLVYKATENINLYGSYIEGFQMQTDAYLGTSNFRMDGATGEIVREPFSPKTSKSWEFGAKTEWLGGKLHANLAFYHIKQKNVLTYDDGVGMVDELMSEGATEKNKGIELDIMGRILPNWLINAGYTYMDAFQMKDQLKYRKDNTPKHSFNLWTRYDVKQGAMKDFGFGLGMNYVDEKISWQERDLILPAYTLVDAAVYYKLKDMQLALNLNNVFNKTYWLGAFNYPRLFPGTPRNLMFNVRYSF